MCGNGCAADVPNSNGYAATDVWWVYRSSDGATAAATNVRQQNGCETDAGQRRRMRGKRCVAAAVADLRQRTWDGCAAEGAPQQVLVDQTVENTDGLWPK